MTCEPFDVVTVPFPFTDRHAARRRPAVVVSSAAFHAATGHVTLLMITSARHSAWPFDHPVADRVAAGLPSPCVVRAKCVTLNAALVHERRGALGAEDRAAVGRMVGEVFAIA